VGDLDNLRNYTFSKISAKEKLLLSKKTIPDHTITKKMQSFKTISETSWVEKC